MMIDTHAHLDFPDFDRDRGEVIKRAKDVGVEKIINIGCNLETCQSSFDLAEKYDDIYSVIGVHPHEVAKQTTDEVMECIDALVKNEKVVGIGEIGLDYFKLGDIVIKEKQKELFKKQFEFALEVKKPVVIHSRDAFTDTLKILEKYKNDFDGVMHCYGGDWKWAKKFLEIGLMISFTGVVTYPNADNVREVVKKMPLERMMIETDCPFLAPQQKRGERNEPAYVKYVLDRIIEIRNEGREEIERQIYKNSERFFGI